MPAKQRARPKGAIRKATRKATRRTSRASLRAQLAQQRSLEALHMVRSDRLSFTEACKQAGTTPRTVLRHVGKALKRGEDGRYTATKFDRLPRTLRFLTAQGRIELTVRNSRTASQIARYMAAVHKYLTTGDRRALWPFRGKAIRAGKIAYPFLTDGKTLERLAFAGEVSFEELYSLTTGETK